MISRRSILAGGAALAGAVGAAGSAPAFAFAVEEIPLWPGKPPGGNGPSGPEKIGGAGTGYGAVSNIATPRLRVYRPNIANGRAVIVCGGGGYFRIQLWKESTPAAKWLQLHGYTVFELIYRLPRDGWDASAPFADAQRAMKIVRTRAADFGIAPDRIGIMGMSAGGHLAGFTAPRRAPTSPRCCFRWCNCASRSTRRGRGARSSASIRPKPPKTPGRSIRWRTEARRR